MNFLTSTLMMSLEVGCNIKYHYQDRVVEFLTITPINYREVGIQNLNQLPLGFLGPHSGNELTNLMNNMN